MGRSDGDYAADRLLSDQLHSRRNELGQSSSLASGHPGSLRESAVGQSAVSFSSVFRSRFPPDGLENLALP